MRAMTGRVALVGILALACGGCASMAELRKLQREQKETRIQLADTTVALDSLRRQVEQLRTQIEEAGKGGRRAGGSANLERRLAALEARLAGADGGGLAVSSPTIAGGEAVPPSARGTEGATIALRGDTPLLATAPEAFRLGVELYKQGQFDRAVGKLREFVRAGKSDLSDNAQYWIGECYFNQGDYSRAIIEFNEVLVKYPQGDRIPTTLLALATAFANSPDPDGKKDARLILQKLVNEYGSSEEARIGRLKLDALSE